MGPATTSTVQSSGHFGLLQQVDGLGLIFVLGQQILELREPVAVGVVDLVLAAAGDEADRARAALSGRG